MSTVVSENIKQSQTPAIAPQRYDLHTHTNLSDGKLSPQALVERANTFQIDVLSITDHDTTKALDIAHRYIESSGSKLKLINGIEISTRWQSFEIHIVGLNIDPQHGALRTLIEEQQASREQRAVKISEKLAKCGFDNMLEQAQALAGEGSITRAHFAQVLFNQGKVSKLQSAFDKYIGRGKRAFVQPTWCDIAKAVETIHLAGGVAVIAHPMRYDMTSKWLRRLIVDFKSAGGDAMEIVLPQMNSEQRRLMLSFCLEYDLYASLGSDFHYPSKWSDLGKNLSLPDNCKPVWQLWQS